MLIERRSIDPIQIKIKKMELTTKRANKYLRVWIDEKMSFKAKKRRLLHGVVSSILLYDAPVWWSAIKFHIIRKRPAGSCH